MCAVRLRSLSRRLKSAARLTPQSFGTGNQLSTALGDACWLGVNVLVRHADIIQGNPSPELVSKIFPLMLPLDSLWSLTSPSLLFAALPLPPPPSVSVQSNTMSQVARAVRAILGLDTLRLPPSLSRDTPPSPPPSSPPPAFSSATSASPAQLNGWQLSDLCAASTSASPARGDNSSYSYGSGSGSEDEGPSLADGRKWSAMANQSLLEDEVDALEVRGEGGMSGGDEGRGNPGRRDHRGEMRVRGFVYSVSPP